MKKLLVLVAVMLAVTLSQGFAAPIGPLWTHADRGLFIGLGYSYVDADWEPKTEGAAFYNSDNLETTQHQLQAQLGLVFAKGWAAYVGGGFSTLRADHAYRSSEKDVDAGLDFDLDTIEDDTFPFGTAGISGLLIDGKALDIGFFGQVNYQSEYEDEVVSSGDLGAGTELLKEEFKLEPGWDATGGLIFQGELEGAYLYGGPILYTSKADAKSVVRGQTSGLVDSVSVKVEESENFGAIAGIRWPLKRGAVLDLELQKRSGLNVGLALNKAF